MLYALEYYDIIPSYFLLFIWVFWSVVKTKIIKTTSCCLQIQDTWATRLASKSVSQCAKVIEDIYNTLTQSETSDDTITPPSWHIAGCGRNSKTQVDRAESSVQSQGAAAISYLRCLRGIFWTQESGVVSEECSDFVRTIISQAVLKQALVEQGIII